MKTFVKDKYNRSIDYSEWFAVNNGKMDLYMILWIFFIIIQNLDMFDFFK